MPGARVVSDERVTLRTVEEEDLLFLQRASANPEIRYPLGTPIRNRDEIEDSYENGDSDRFLVCLDEDSAGPTQATEDDVTRLGVVNVMDADWKRPELGYWLVPEFHGDGYGKEVVSLVLDYVFREYSTPAVGAQAFEFNDASRGLLESLGFTKEGRLRKFMFVDGEHRDMVQYGLIRQEWCEQKSSRPE